ncbi:uncharacterized protein LOC127166271 isoform X2 [Labeo rohita]|uniref:uncharacterized protein LOC127166271 isoform X2 n=1 Tax=Labeo rohita TaxID=84645 RepID=UPI0021E316B6|nr:uncharacterized protein LOC127166271 isoform X2 [Labeo rohita]
MKGSSVVGFLASILYLVFFVGLVFCHISPRIKEDAGGKNTVQYIKEDEGGRNSTVPNLKWKLTAERKHLQYAISRSSLHLICFSSSWHGECISYQTCDFLLPPGHHSALQCFSI